VSVAAGTVAALAGLAIPRQTGRTRQ
jgi:hypothetical protein